MADTQRQSAFIERLLAGPDDVELSKRDLALLEAHLHQPISYSAVYREQKSEGESQILRDRNKLKLIRDFNRLLNAQDSKVSRKRTIRNTRSGESRLEKLPPTTPVSLASENSPQHPDGPEPPHWLWLKGVCHRIGKGRSQRSWTLLNYFWQHDNATFENLYGPGKLWPDPVSDSAISSAINRFNTQMPAGLTWKLIIKNRIVSKESRENPPV
jgi:hypothetical protein